MKYFTAQLWTDINSPRSKAAMEKWDRNLEEYLQSLNAILPKLGTHARRFFRSVSLHDGTLTRMEVGDQIDNPESSWKGGNVNSRNTGIRLYVLSAEGDQTFKLNYKHVSRIELRFPGESCFLLGGG
jgi:hypothetical protein